jgi:CheY-like chemotaxis protein
LKDELGLVHQDAAGKATLGANVQDSNDVKTSANNTSPPRILLVEDEVLVRMFAVDALEDAGFKVEQAGSATEAMTQLSALRGDINAVIVDLGLPDRPGSEVAEEIRALHTDLPILIASGRSERELQERFRTGPVAVLVKPYTASMLLDTLAKLGVPAPNPY